MMVKAIVLASVACALLVGADQPSAKEDREALKGTWKQTRWMRDGQTKDQSDTTITVSSDSILVKHGDQEERSVAYTIDPARKTIDLKIEQEGRTMYGIYKLQGKTLAFCFHPETRPEKLAAEPGTGNILMEFEKP